VNDAILAQIATKLDAVSEKLETNTGLTKEIALAVLGDGSKEKPGLSGRVLVLEEARVNQKVWSGAAIAAALTTLITTGWTWLTTGSR
jgi:hypothetical protein